MNIASSAVKLPNITTVAQRNGFFFLIKVAAQLRFDVAMASVSPPPFDAMEGLEDALMEVMRGTAVSFSTI